MRGLDTNVLVRYLVRDEPAQERAALAFIEALTETGEPIFVNAVVLCELVWVLRSSYDYSRQDVAAVVEKVLSAEQFEIEDVDAAWLALGDFKAGRGDYADCLIGRRNAQLGCEATATLDGRLEGSPGFELLPHATRPRR